ncbi:MAG: trypsin-like serine protease [Xanthomonadaceae bacterium]|nr:trypsin-like serine protease [Rhodospirillaceae bacterium]NIA17887.1 trypsin-like serine protease [Xanthomonadaceae bacterium]
MKKVFKKVIFLFLSIAIISSSLFFVKIKQKDSLADILFQEQTETISAIDQAKKSVVSIIKTEELTKIITNNLGQTQIDANFKQVAGGSGIIVDKNGLILTNKHVVSFGDKYSVILNNGEIYDGKVVARDPLKDLALVKIDEKNLSIIKFANSRNLKIGQTVMTVGYALGRYENSVTKGIISGLHRDLTASDSQGKIESLSNIIQTDAAINPGNSGGALINLNGELVGVNVATELDGENVGFAIPSNSVNKAIRSYKKYGKIIRPKLGVRYSMLNPTIKKFIGLPRKQGAWIHSGDGPAVVPNSPANKAGLLENDIIFEINAIKITEDLPLCEVISFYEPNQTIGLKVQRGNKVIILKVKLGSFE